MEELNDEELKGVEGGACNVGTTGINVIKSGANLVVLDFGKDILFPIKITEIGFASGPEGSYSWQRHDSAIIYKDTKDFNIRSNSQRNPGILLRVNAKRSGIIIHIVNTSVKCIKIVYKNAQTNTNRSRKITL